jgi:hypothetical protein
VTRCIIRTATDMFLVPLDPPLSPGDIEIDLSNLTEANVPLSRTVTPRMDEAALRDLVERTRK